MKMKKFLLIALVAMAAIACSKGDDSVGVVDCPEGMGIVGLSVSPTTVVDGTRAQQQQIPDGVTIPTADDLKLKIVSEDANLDYSEEWENVTSFTEKSKKTYFVAGMYRAIVTFGDPQVEGVNKPYFVDDEGFNVVARQKNEVKLYPALANSIVKVEFSDTFKSYFENGAAITITSGNGNKWNVGYGIEAENGDNNQDGSTPYIFVESGKELIISGYAVKQKPSATIAAPKVVFEDVKESLSACTMCTYTFDITTAGNVSVTIAVTNEPVKEVEVSNGEELNDDAIE